jgi:hypothetical protein
MTDNELRAEPIALTSRRYDLTADLLPHAAGLQMRGRARYGAGAERFDIMTIRAGHLSKTCGQGLRSQRIPKSDLAPWQPWKASFSIPAKGGVRLLSIKLALLGSLLTKKLVSFEL